jgi:sugar phosphate isomerase/epimerase
VLTSPTARDTIRERFRNDTDIMPTSSDGSIKLSCRLEVLPGKDVREQIANAARFGFDAVSLPGRYLDRYLGQLKTALPDIELPIASISLGFRGSLVSPDGRRRAECAKSVLELFDVCVGLGAQGLNMPPVLIQDNERRYRVEDFADGEEAVRIQDNLILAELPQIAEEAAKRSVFLFLEPVNRYESDYMNSVTHAARICRALGHPNIGVTCDFFHMQLQELSPTKSIEEAGPWVKYVHVAENTRVEPGPGSLDFTGGFGALKRIGYSGTIEVECRSLSGPPQEVLPRSAKYLRRSWQEA